MPQPLFCKGTFMAKKKQRSQSKKQKQDSDSKQLAKTKAGSKKAYIKNKEKKKPGWKVESINTKAEFTCSGVSYHSIVAVVGKFMLGDKGFEFYNDRNVRDFIQIPWDNIEAAGANVHGRRVSRHFEIYTDAGKFLFASKESGKILKIMR